MGRGRECGIITTVSTVPALRVAPVDRLLRDAVLALRVRSVQRAFVGHVADLLADAESRASCEPMAILNGGTPIGFYCLEHNVRTVAARDFDQPALGLRGFLIDAAHQGRGLGAAAVAALLADAMHRHPAARLLVLSVDAGNRAAIALYRRAGFEACPARYHGPPASSQHILLRPLET